MRDKVRRATEIKGRRDSRESLWVGDGDGDGDGGLYKMFKGGERNLATIHKDFVVILMGYFSFAFLLSKSDSLLLLFFFLLF